MSFSFGTPSSAPATGGLTGGFSFGASKPATPGFGLTATSQPSTGLFGSTPAASTPAFGAATPAFGATATPAFGAASATPAFGATATPAFGATSAAPAFGATATPAFGATATPAFGTTTTPAFGAPTSTAFGASATPAFGATAAPAFGATSAPAFGATATPAFGATATPAFGATATPAFGASAAPTFGATSTPSLGLGTGGLNFGAPTNTAAPSGGLSFGAPAASTANTGLGGLSGFSFGGATAQNTGFGILGGTSTATTTNSLFGAKLGTTTATGTQPSTLDSSNLGLKGLGAPAGAGATTTTASDGKGDPPKLAKLPNEILTTVAGFKEFVKKQKSLSTDVMRVSVKPLQKVASSAESRLRAALSLSGEVSRARAASRRLRATAAAALAAAETAARDTPGVEPEGCAPPEYVREVIAELEQQLATFCRQMDAADKQMQAEPKVLTEQELSQGMRRMHEALVQLAARLQAQHTQVQAQKEQYLNLRKYVLKDPTDVFDTTPSSSNIDMILNESDTASKKKVKLADTLGGAVLADPRLALSGNLSQLAGPTPFSYIGNTLSPYPAADISGVSVGVGTPALGGASWSSGTHAGGAALGEGFQLQKPPGKRGKQ